MPAVAYLLLLRDARELRLPADIEVDWLHGVGLDGTMEECGLAVLSDPDPVLDLARADDRVRVFRPISEKVRATQ